MINFICIETVFTSLKIVKRFIQYSQSADSMYELNSRLCTYFALENWLVLTLIFDCLVGLTQQHSD